MYEHSSKAETLYFGSGYLPGTEILSKTVKFSVARGRGRDQRGSGNLA